MSALPRYAAVRSAFEIRTVLEVVARSGSGRFEFCERRLEQPVIKDYDMLEDPLSWPRRFDVSKWGLLVASVRGVHAGGAVVARDTPGVDMLESRRDLAVLWDLRVAHGMRRCGIGTALFRAAERWARAQGCRELKIETQNVNVPACRFYARQGCVLSAAQPFAYAQLRDEVRLLWRKELRGEETI